MYISMSGSTTRISDLPSISAAESALSSNATRPRLDGQQSSGLGSNTYIPINFHPTPFDAGGPGGGPGDPQLGGGPVGHGGPGGPPAFKLPSRDIPNATPEFTHDPQIVANHIPPPPPDTRLVDHVRDMERAFAHDAAPIRTKAQKRAEFVGSVITKAQIPMLVAALYFAFGTTGLNRLLQTYCAFLGIFAADGSVSLRGLAIKSALFGVVFFVVSEVIAYIIREFGEGESGGGDEYDD
jgi:hypothetical protein